MHILVAGFQHETNTFAPSKAGYDNFVRGEGFPAMVRGEAMLALRQVNIPAGGFINAVVAQGHTVRTVIWAAPARPPTSPPTPMSASPARSSRRRAKAATTPSTWTCTAPWSPSTWTTAKASCWRACARAVPAGRAVIASLDLHANVTAQMLGEADGLAAFRTYPHVDMADTGEHAARLLLARLEAGANWHRTSAACPS